MPATTNHGANKMKRYITAAVLTTGLALGAAAPAEAIVIVHGAEAVVGRVAERVTFDAGVAEGVIQPGIVKAEDEVRVTTESGRS